MDHTFSIAPKAVAVSAHTAPVPRHVDTKVPVVTANDRAAVLPPDKPFIAQIVNARLSGTAFPETEAEILPQERKLRPYGVPMLPYDSDEDGQHPATSDQADMAKAVDTTLVPRLA